MPDPLPSSRIPSDPSLELNLRLDFWTQYRATYVLSRRLPGTWLAYFFFVGVPTLLLIVAPLLGKDLTQRGPYDLPWWTILLSGYVFMFVVFPLLALYQLWSLTRRSPAFFGERRYAFTPEGMSVAGKTFQSSYTWSALYRAIEARGFIMLYVSTRAAFSLPKAQLSDETLAKLRALLTHYLRARARLQGAVARFGLAPGAAVKARASARAAFRLSVAHVPRVYR